MGYRRLTLREALASDRLEDFVRQEEARGVELAVGSDLERALALLITQRPFTADPRVGERGRSYNSEKQRLEVQNPTHAALVPNGLSRL